MYVQHTINSFFFKIKFDLFEMLDYAEENACLHFIIITNEMIELGFAAADLIH